MNFVDRVLFLHTRTGIEKFRLKCRDSVDSSRICGWLSAAAWHGVQHLDLEIVNFKFTSLPGFVFMCRTLVTLKLDINSDLNIPNSVCFPNLKTLYLKSMYLDDPVERLFSGCTSLEDLVLGGCRAYKIKKFKISHHLLKTLTMVDLYYDSCECWIEIDAPMLVYFKYNDYPCAKGYSFENLNSLVSADIDFRIISRFTLHDATSLFKGISNVHSLNLSPSSLRFLSSCKPFPVFPKMVELKICGDIQRSLRNYYSQKKRLAGVLLSSLPELEKLAFNQEVFITLPKKVPFCLLYKVKAIEISEFVAVEKCIEKAKYFLENAGVVEKLIIRTRSFVTEKEKLKISEELLASLRKSKQCSIMII